jgi:tight adherence protein C
MTLLLFIICMGTTVLALLFGVINLQRQQQVQHHLTQLAIALPARDKVRHLSRNKQLNTSFTHRVVFPFAQNTFDVIQAFIPLTSKSWVKTKLIQAGFSKAYYPKVFLGIQFLLSLGVFSVLLVFTTLFGKVPGATGSIIAVFFGLAGYGLPMLWLLQQAQKRQESIQKSLADFLDLLVICVEAGLGLDTAINKITQLKSAKTSVYLRDELIRYSKDVSFGKPRKQALLDIAHRTGVDDLNTLINALVQAYEMGTGVSQTLRVQSDSMRIKRLQKAEEKANKIPVKMVLPIYIFLFPSIFLTIFGPIGMVLVKTVLSIFSKMGNFGS